MLEYLFLRFFYKKLADIAQEKNRARAWGWLGILAWISGEIGGAIIAAGSHTEDTGTLYVFALGGAAIGATISYIIVKSLSELPIDKDFPSARVV
jgi:hypothetical protein